MTIKFTRRNGEQVETNDRSVLLAAVETNDIRYGSIVEIDGAFARAVAHGLEFTQLDNVEKQAGK